MEFRILIYSDYHLLWLFYALFYVTMSIIRYILCAVYYVFV